MLPSLIPRSLQHEPEEVAELGSKLLTTYPTIGGAINPTTDWADAWPSSIGQTFFACDIGTTCGLGNTVSSQIWIKNDARDLYIAIRGPADPTNSLGADFMFLSFDEDHDGLLDPRTASGNAGEDHRGVFGSAPSTLSDNHWPNTLGTVTDDDFPGRGADGAGSGFFDDVNNRWDYEFRIPLNSPDSLDLNVHSGAILGLKITVARDGVGYQFPQNGGVDVANNPSQWADIATVAAFQFAIGHADDTAALPSPPNPGFTAFLLIQNTGVGASTLVFVFYNPSTGAVVDTSTLSLARGVRTAQLVRTLRGTTYVGPILIFSDDSFSGQMNQHGEPSALFGILPIQGQN